LGGAAPGRLVKRSRGGPSATLSLLLAVCMVVSLSVSVPFLIAKRASLVTSDLISAPMKHSPALVDRDSGGDEEDPNPTILKRLRGAIVSKTEVGKLLVLLVAALESTGVLVDEGSSGYGPISADEPEPGQGESLPQELLRRPPPIG